MGVNEDIERNVKLSFSKVKEHMTLIESELNANKGLVTQLKDEIVNLKKEIESLRNERILPVETDKPSEPQNQGLNDVSSGNQGVYSFTHSLTKHSFNSYSLLKQDFDRLFTSLSQQEFLTFLTIYHLEEEIKQVSYLDVAKKMALTEGCIRTYVSSLLKKGLPIIKQKYNNKQVFLTIYPEFRSLNLKQKLIDTFYHTDPSQKTLGQQF